MTIKDQQLARQLIMKHESFRDRCYVDTTGNLTIGYGHNLRSVPITNLAGEQILDDDLQWHIIHLPIAYPTFNNLNAARQAVLLDMSYNLGLQGLLAFEKMLQAIKEENWKVAEFEMLNSKWADQVGSRAKEDALIMVTGVYRNGL